MDTTVVEPIARALLYEGYILYPYRANSLKNRHRWTIGGLVPRAYGEPHSEPWFLRAECLVRGDVKAKLSVSLRFLHPVERKDGKSIWQEAVEEEITVADLRLAELVTNSRTVPLAIPESLAVEASVERKRHTIEGTLDLSATKLMEGVIRVTVQVANGTPLEMHAKLTRDEVMLRTLASAHIVFGVRDGEFVSMTDPPEDLKAFADGCRNVGVWPILVGDAARRNTMLASPIILSDFPQIAPESVGDFFDGTEIDEMLALRILTLTDVEKREMARLEPRTRALLDHVEGLSDSRLASLHGTSRSPQPGDRVRLRPFGRADAFDMLLTGKAAIVTSTETDFEGKTYVTVTVDDDPGRDLGGTGMPGHRFFFRPDEVVRLTGDES
jgi:hypothetical protein